MNKTQLDKLTLIATKQTNAWLNEADFRFDNKSWLEKSQLIALKILRTLRHKNLTQKDFAKQMAVSPQVVNKWLKGSENFTLQTICKIQDALKISLLVDLNNSPEMFQTNVSLNNFTKFKDLNMKYEKIKPQETAVNNGVFSMVPNSEFGRKIA